MIRVYTTGCPNCLVLERKLKEKNIEFEEIKDIEVIKEAAKANNYTTVPLMEIGGVVLDFRKAIEKLKTI